MTTMNSTSFLLITLATLHIAYIESNKELTPPSSSRMSLNRRAQILELEIASERYQWLNQEVTCGPCTMTHNTISNILSITTGCLATATSCITLAHVTDDYPVFAFITAPCTFLAGGLISDAYYSLDQSEKKQTLAEIKKTLKRKEKLN